MKKPTKPSISVLDSLRASLAALSSFDVSDLNDLDAIAEWPSAVRSLVHACMSLAVVGLGYWFLLHPQLNELSLASSQEMSLRSELSLKAKWAGELGRARRQSEELQGWFAQLVRQLPSTSELPRLVDDITDIGLGSGLSFERLQLQGQSQSDFFYELPMDIELLGNYHDFGTFAGGVASLGRIVTLHDFKITVVDDTNLAMTLVAKTYRYDDQQLSLSQESVDD